MVLKASAIASANGVQAATETLRYTTHVTDDCNAGDTQCPLSMMPLKDIMKLKRLEAKRRKPPDAPVLRRKPFCASKKKAVCEMFEATSMSHQALADHFGVNRSMITRILNKKERWLKSKHTPGFEFARKRCGSCAPRASDNYSHCSSFRINRFWEIEDALMPWLMECRERGVPVTNKMIRERAISAAEKMGMRGGGHPHQFIGGRPWLKTFIARFGIIDGVATRLGFTEADLAREKAYGCFPLDEPFLIQIPDEHGNFRDPFRVSPSKYQGIEFERRGAFVVPKFRAATSTPAEPSEASCASSSSHSPDNLSPPTTFPGPSSNSFSYMVSSPQSSSLRMSSGFCSSTVLDFTPMLPLSGAAASLRSGEPAQWTSIPPSHLPPPRELDATDLNTSFISSRLPASAPLVSPYTLVPLSSDCAASSPNATAQTFSGVPTPLPANFGSPGTSAHPSLISVPLNVAATLPITPSSPDTSISSSSKDNSPATPTSLVHSYLSAGPSTHEWAPETCGDMTLQVNVDRPRRYSVHSIFLDTASSGGTIRAAINPCALGDDSLSVHGYTISQASGPLTTPEPYMGSGARMHELVAPWT